jgi:SAM-dependent methyltransferase
MKRSFCHWSARYFRDRLAYAIYRLRRPDVPWITPAAVGFLDEWLGPQDVGIEWGSGSSTAWLASRMGRLVSIEHDADWYRKTADDLARRHLENVQYVLAEVADGAGGPDHPYVTAARKAPAGKVSFALVDGVLRDHCAKLALELLRPGGLLVIDDAHRYLPHASRSPNALGEQASPAGDIWQGVHDKLRTWRRYWTSNGIKDTVFYVRPCRPLTDTSQA